MVKNRTELAAYLLTLSDQRVITEEEAWQMIAILRLPLEDISIAQGASRRAVSEGVECGEAVRAETAEREPIRFAGPSF